MYNCELVGEHRDQVRRLKDEYEEDMADCSRPAVKLYVKKKRP